MTKAAHFADKAERLARNGNKSRTVKLHRILGHAERVSRLSDSIVSRTQREIALYRIWNAYATVQTELSSGADEFRDAHVLFNWDEYIMELDES
jgi:hypothetical protein